MSLIIRKVASVLTSFSSAPLLTRIIHLLALSFLMINAIALVGCVADKSDETLQSADVAEIPLHIVASTTILGDLVKNIVGEQAIVSVLLPPGADPHDGTGHGLGYRIGNVMKFQV